MPEEIKEPEDLIGLHKYIWDKVTKEEISNGVGFYAIGWLFYDLFERCDHEKDHHQAQIQSADLDRFVRDLPLEKIERDLYEAQQQFGRDAAAFMEDDTKVRIQEEIDKSVVATVRAIQAETKTDTAKVAADVRAFTSGVKAFGFNVLAGVVSGLVFAAISLGIYFYVRVDPSLNALGKNGLAHEAPTEAAPAPTK